MSHQNIVRDPDYRQPIREYIGRVMEGTLEQVDYVPQTHLRIWHNTQPEGYALHYHDAIELIMVKENNYPITILDKEYILEPGDICFVPSRALHWIKGGRGERFILLLDTAPLSSFSDFHALEPMLMRPWIFNDHTFQDLYVRLYQELSEIISIYFSGSDMWELAIYSRLLHILELAGQYYLQRKSAPSEDNPGQTQINYEKFANLMNYIDLHYSEQLTLEWAADYVGFSKYHFHRLFKDYTGITFHDHLINKRIQIAQSLLSTDLSITEIAFRSGFTNSSSFGRVFRSQTGMSPSDFRKRRETVDSHGMSNYIHS
ncbi:MAG: AraC family transcriptional regulator [Lachnospiraceae bacterium]|nr:AraC family transcriptional regulator [Lachnospiraceae bacterium]